MTGYTDEARRQIESLGAFYREKGRPDALLNLLDALEKAEALIDHNPTAGLAAPRPYPRLRREGRFWIKVGTYWIAYVIRPSRVIIAVFHDRADIPGRS